MKKTYSCWSPKITKELNYLGNHHLLFENKYKIRKEAFFFLHFKQLIKEIDYRTNNS